MPSLTLSPEKSPLRLKTLLLQWGMSQQYWKKCKEAGVLKVNGAPTSWDLLLSPGDTVTWEFLPETSAVEPEPAALDIVYEDDVLLAVNKPAGLVTHNSSPDPQPALSRRVAWYYQTHQIPAAIHPVSRLDRETSGLVLFAKNACIHHMLSQQKLRKEYWGLTTGHWDPPKGCLNGPIARAPGSIIRRQVDPSGAPAVTHYQVLETFGDYEPRGLCPGDGPHPPDTGPLRPRRPSPGRRPPVRSPGAPEPPPAPRKNPGAYTPPDQGAPADYRAPACRLFGLHSAGKIFPRYGIMSTVEKI